MSQLNYRKPGPSKTLPEHLVLLALSSLLLLSAYKQGYLYGSACDWFSQHISIAETMRQTFYETGSLFPSMLPLGGGINIYDFAYYGYLRPDVLISCLFPSISMEVIITVYMAAGYLTSVQLFRTLLGKMNLRPVFCFFGSLLFLSAGCFFHLHRQIMFINYMPFLIGALLACLYLHKTGKKRYLILMLVLIELHSFYFSISCLLLIFLFYLHTAKENTKLSHCFIHIKRFCFCAICSVFMSGLLLLPSAASILAAGGKGTGRAAMNLFSIQTDFTSVLYNPYGLGLALPCLFLFLLSLSIKRLRRTSILLLCCFMLEIVPYVLNGFLYARGKILIPFLPFIILLAADVFQHYWEERTSPSLLLIPAVSIIAVLQYKQHSIVWIFADLALTLVLWCVLFLRSRNNYTCCRIPPLLPTAILSAFPFCFAVIVHNQDPFVSKEHISATAFSEDELNNFYQDPSYRFDSFLDSYQTVNQMLAPGAGRTSMYTSITNPAYNEFYFDVMRTPIRINNRVAMPSEANPFFQYFMGVRYLETTKSKLPYGYQIRQASDKSVLAENADVLPLYYGSSSLLTQSAFDSLLFPDTLEALTSQTIVPDAASSSASDKFTDSHFVEIDLGHDTDYQIETISDTNYRITPVKPIANQILVLTFDVTSLSGNAVTITINGVRNKLSGRDAPYPNNNTTFTYVISSPDAISKLDIKTIGQFEINNLQVFLFPEDSFGFEQIYPFEEEAATGSDIINGTIDMLEEGYFVTSLPMQPGYRAYVDGELCEPETVNTCFVGIPLTSGRHTIQITYRPPLQLAGAAMSILGWCWFGIIVYKERKHL